MLCHYFAAVCTMLHLGSQPAMAASIPFSAASEITTAALPPLKLDPNGPVGEIALNSQVMRRAAKLGLDLNSALGLDGNAPAEAAQLDALTTPPLRGHVVDYNGATLSGLAKLLAPDTRILITSPALTIDAPLVVNKPHVTIEFGETKLSASPAWAQAIAAGHSEAILQVKSAQDVLISGGFIDNAEGVLVQDSSRVVISGVNINAAPGYGVVIAGNSQDVVVADGRFTGLAASGIAVLPGAQDVLLERNVITRGTGNSNQQAGILVTARTEYSHIGGPNFLLVPSDLPDGTKAYQFAPETAVTSFTTPPRDVLIIGNDISSNKTNGVYLDGAVLTYVSNNQIKGNSKEGICLDNGSTANDVVDNEITANGGRWGKSDDDLRVDFVLQFGRMADGTANAKLPGISLDNAALNIVVDNHIEGNDGSGIKMVRTSFYNLIGRNLISDNNAGSNAKFFFFGVEIGGAPGDTASSALDFTPSMGNIIFQNIVAGPHHSGIQFCPDCGYNDVFDNMIIRPQVFALEQTSPAGTNIFTNNFSMAPSRNATLNGPDGRVLLGGEGVYDQPPAPK